MMSAQSRGIYHMQLKDDISAKPSWAPWRTLHSSSPWRTEWSWSSPSWASLKRWSSSWTWTWLWSSSSSCIWTSQSAGSKIVFCGLRSAALERMFNIGTSRRLPKDQLLTIPLEHVGRWGRARNGMTRPLGSRHCERFTWPAGLGEDKPQPTEHLSQNKTYPHEDFFWGFALCCLFVCF